MPGHDWYKHSSSQNQDSGMDFLDSKFVLTLSHIGSAFVKFQETGHSLTCEITFLIIYNSAYSVGTKHLIRGS